MLRFNPKSTLLATTWSMAILVGCGKAPISDEARSTVSPQSTAPEFQPSSADHARLGNPSQDSNLAHQPISEHDAREALDPNASPETVVSAFLEATRRGDDQLARQLLSTRALEATSKAGLAVQPPGTPHMTYRITQVEFPQGIEHGAYVHSIWTETTDGVEESFDVTWVLRKDPQGWRIVGMAAQFDDESQPYFLNFEQPDELFRRLKTTADGGQTRQTDAAGAATETPQTARMPDVPPIR